MTTRCFVLEGGGATGAFQVGVMSALEEKGIVPDVLYGTSVGSLNGLCLSYFKASVLEDIWRKKIRDFSDVMKLNWSSLWFKSPGVFNLRPLRKIVEDAMRSRGERRFPMYSCVLDITTNAIDFISNDSELFIDAVIGSSAQPGIMDPVGSWVDGGVREQVPLKRALREGCDETVVVLNNSSRPVLQRYSIGSWLENAVRGIEILSLEARDSDVHLCKARADRIRVIEPTKVGLGFLDFDGDKIDQAIDHGKEVGRSLIF